MAVSQKINSIYALPMCSCAAATEILSKNLAHRSADNVRKRECLYSNRWSPIFWPTTRIGESDKVIRNMVRFDDFALPLHKMRVSHLVPIFRFDFKAVKDNELQDLLHEAPAQTLKEHSDSSAVGETTISTPLHIMGKI